MENCEVWFTQDELIEIYHAAGDQAELNALKEAAVRLYPEKMVNGGPAMFVREGVCGRGFVLEEDPEKWVIPKYTISGGRLNWIGILPDGTAVKY